MTQIGRKTAKRFPRVQPDKRADQPTGAQLPKLHQGAPKPAQIETPEKSTDRRGAKAPTQARAQRKGTAQKRRAIRAVTDEDSGKKHGSPRRASADSETCKKAPLLGSQAQQRAKENLCALMKANGCPPLEWIPADIRKKARIAEAQAPTASRAKRSRCWALRPNSRNLTTLRDKRR